MAGNSQERVMSQAQRRVLELSVTIISTFDADVAYMCNANMLQEKTGGHLSPLYVTQPDPREGPSPLWRGQGSLRWVLCMGLASGFSAREKAKGGKEQHGACSLEAGDRSQSCHRAED